MGVKIGFFHINTTGPWQHISSVRIAVSCRILAIAAGISGTEFLSTTRPQSPHIATFQARSQYQNNA